MKKVVFVSSRMPLPVVSGRQKMIMQTLEVLSKRFEVVLIVVGRDGSEIPTFPKFVSKVFFVEKPNAREIIGNFFISELDTLQGRLFVSRRVEKRICEIVESESDVDTVLFDMIRMSRLCEVVKRRNPHIRTIMDFDDRLSQRYEQMKERKEENVMGFMGEDGFLKKILSSMSKFIFFIESKLVEKKELSITEFSDAVCFISSKEAEDYKRDIGVSDVFVGCNPPIARLDKLVSSDDAIGYDIVFIGNGKYGPNIEAIEEFDYLAKWSKENKLNNLRFRIIGYATEQFEKDYMKAGYVENMGSILNDRSILLAPIKTGTGIKIKILDCISKGVPTITTRKGIEGLSLIDGESVVLYNNLEDIKKILIDLNIEKTSEYMKRVGAEGLKVAKREHLRKVVEEKVFEMMECKIKLVEKKKDYLKKILNFVMLLASDIFSAFIAIFIAFYIASELAVFLESEEYVYFYKAFFDRISIFEIVLSGIVVWNYLKGMYTERNMFWDEVKNWFIVVLFGFVVEGFVQYVLKEHVSRLWIFTSWLLWLPIGIFVRQFVKRILVWSGVKSDRVAVVSGDPKFYKKVLEEDYGFGFDVVECIDVEGDVIGQIVKDNIDFVVVEIGSGNSSEKMKSILDEVNKIGVKVVFSHQMNGVNYSMSKMISVIGQDFVLTTEKEGLLNPLSGVLKRFIDLVVAFLMLVTLSPLIFLCGLWVKKDGGPMLYSQKRIGQNGRSIRIWKLRSMVQDAEKKLEGVLNNDAGARREWYENGKLKNDPRITKFGKFLRMSTIDELPQLWNVLIGDMSLVGPRPVLHDELKLYEEKKYFYLKVKPGLTGLWQVSGRSDLNYEKRMMLDVWYVKNWSLWIDFVIIMKTVPSVLMRRGAR